MFFYIMHTYLTFRTLAQLLGAGEEWKYFPFLFYHLALIHIYIIEKSKGKRGNQNGLTSFYSCALSYSSVPLYMTYNGILFFHFDFTFYIPWPWQKLQDYWLMPQRRQPRSRCTIEHSVASFSFTEFDKLKNISWLESVDIFKTRQEER